ncbi:hypothetical protein BC937DRAFT_87671, partial [Endogone sp. FLAS-F59071]
LPPPHHLYISSTPFASLDSSSLTPPANAELKPSTSSSSFNRVMATTSKKSLVTTHILVASKGIPGKNIPVKLEFMEAGDVFTLRAVGTSDHEGRCNTLLGNDNKLKKGTYRLTFHTKTFFENLGEKCFYPYVTITFEVTKDSEHYHIPLLISPYSYTTYRGTRLWVMRVGLNRKTEEISLSGRYQRDEN